MRKFLVNVNGTEYEVAVEEITGEFAAPIAPAQVSAPLKPTNIPNPEVVVTKPANVAGGKCDVEAPMPGTILDVKVKPGDSVKAGDTLFILEAMKMENEILAPENGTVLAVNTVRGASVNSGDLLCVLG
ncbi:MAG: biotin/lipoyl-containing protein [Clostridia bacterium]